MKVCFSLVFFDSGNHGDHPNDHNSSRRLSGFPGAAVEI